MIPLAEDQGERAGKPVMELVPCTRARIQRRHVGNRAALALCLFRRAFAPAFDTRVVCNSSRSELSGLAFHCCIAALECGRGPGLRVGGACGEGGGGEEARCVAARRGR